MKKAAASAPPASARYSERIVRLPRITRILLAALFALALTLAITPVIDGIYLGFFFDPSTRMLPALLSTVLGLVFYGVGWRLMIGYAGETPPPRPVVFWYFGIGVALCALVLFLMIIGAITGTME